MTIKANVIAAKGRIQVNEQPFTDDVKTKALKAIRGGPAEWAEYMKVFADAQKPQQLARLIPTDGTGDDPAMNDARAYLVAAAPCTVDTVEHFEKGISEILDVDLQD